MLMGTFSVTNVIIIHSCDLFVFCTYFVFAQVQRGGASMCFLMTKLKGEEFEYFITLIFLQNKRSDDLSIGLEQMCKYTHWQNTRTWPPLSDTEWNAFGLLLGLLLVAHDRNWSDVSVREKHIKHQWETKKEREREMWQCGGDQCSGAHSAFIWLSSPFSWPPCPPYYIRSSPIATTEAALKQPSWTAT